MTEERQFNKKLNGYFIGFCRKVFRWSPAYKKALKRAFVRHKSGIEYYRCELCKTVMPRPLKRVDHIQPVVSMKGWNGNWETYRRRMFVSEKVLQVLCKKCHDKKTTLENSLRGKS